MERQGIRERGDQRLGGDRSEREGITERGESEIGERERRERAGREKGRRIRWWWWGLKECLHEE